MKRAARAIVTAILAGLLVFAAVPYLRASMVIARAAGVGGWAGRISAWNARAVTETWGEIPTRHGSVRMRLYRPAAGRASRATLLVSGVHAAGVSEPRLVGLSRDLAASGLIVVTPEIPDLKQYRITGRATNIIEDSAVWLAARADLAPDQRVGMMGISFSGGLSIVAAGRPALRDHVAYVFSFGGHGNLPRVLKYLCTGIEPSATDTASGPPRPPHDYGLAVILHAVADRMVPSEQVGQLRHGVETFLWASTLAMVDERSAREEFDKARSLAGDMPEPAAQLMRYVNARDVAALGPRLLPHIGTLGDDPSLSPDQSPPPSAPVYLLHGTDDNVIPAVETRLLAARLKSHTRVRYLLSRLITHAGVDRRPDVLEGWRLLSFWSEILSEVAVSHQLSAISSQD